MNCKVFLSSLVDWFFCLLSHVDKINLIQFTVYNFFLFCERYASFTFLSHIFNAEKNVTHIHVYFIRI